MFKLPDSVMKELEATGLPHRIEGNKLAKVYLDGHYIGSLRPGRNENPSRMVRNFIANVRRSARHIRGAA